MHIGISFCIINLFVFLIKSNEQQPFWINHLLTERGISYQQQEVLPSKIIYTFSKKLVQHTHVSLTEELAQCERDTLVVNNVLSVFHNRIFTDRDQDGVPDSLDKCPDIKGLHDRNGCPDKDLDWVIDTEDECPDDAGTSAMGGCPDTDGDGIRDIDDSCPRDRGESDLSGCPKIDPHQVDYLSNAAQKVKFEPGSDRLTLTSYVVLDSISLILDSSPVYHLRIVGHTDNIGSKISNQILSEKRAKTCVNYLIKKGISPKRITYLGYGESRPLTDNISERGRLVNRRVEFEIYLK